MNREGRSFKDEALRALSKGAYKEALEHFKKHCAQAPEDLRSHLKVGELLERLGRAKEAVQVYRKVAEAYAQDGFLLQAISVNKMILRMDPSLKEVNERLIHLYAEKSKGAIPQLPSIPLFSELNEKELQSLLPHLQSRTFSGDALVCREGEKGDSLFAITRGEVAILRGMAGGKEVEVCRLKEGDWFGEFGFLMDQKRHASVRTLTECEVLEMSRDQLAEVIKIHPRIHQVLRRHLEKRVLDTFLASSPLFASLTFEERGEVAKRFRPLKVPEETFLFRQGDPPTSLYLIKRGEVEVFTQHRSGKRVQWSTLKSGHFFGEIGPLFDKPRTASAKTTCSSELLELPKEDLHACLLRFPHLQSTLREISSQRLRQLKEVLSKEGAEKRTEATV
jgi:CRP-like cAMP-binding protein